MKEPVKKTYTLEYWDCGDKGHRHRTYDVAERCIAQRERIIASKPRNDWTAENNKKLLRLVLVDGLTFREAAGRFDNGISANRARQQFKSALRRALHAIHHAGGDAGRLVAQKGLPELKKRGPEIMQLVDEYY